MEAVDTAIQISLEQRCGADTFALAPPRRDGARRLLHRALVAPRGSVVELLARDAKRIALGGGTTEMQVLTIARHVLAREGADPS